MPLPLLIMVAKIKCDDDLWILITHTQFKRWLFVFVFLFSFPSDDSYISSFYCWDFIDKLTVAGIASKTVANSDDDDADDNDNDYHFNDFIWIHMNRPKQLQLNDSNRKNSYLNSWFWQFYFACYLFPHKNVWISSFSK